MEETVELNILSWITSWSFLGHTHRSSVYKNADRYIGASFFRTQDKAAGELCEVEIIDLSSNVRDQLFNRLGARLFANSSALRHRRDSSESDTFIERQIGFMRLIRCKCRERLKVITL